MMWHSPQNAGLEQFARTRPIACARAGVRCPECGGAAARLLWKEVRDPPEATRATYVCEGCRHFWTARPPEL